MKSDFSPSRRAWNVIMTAVVWAAAVLVIALTVGVIGLVLVRGIPHISWEFLSTTASVLKGTDGILPAILNTLYVILLTLLIVLPLGVGAAVYLTEYASNRKLIEVIEFTNETLAGIPSIIYGLVGMLVFSQALGFQTCLLSGSLTLVVMNLPTIIRTTQESLKTVPQAFGVNSGAYVAELIRGGIMAIDKGQLEAGRSLGFDYVQTMRFIIVPQALKNVLPALANEFIVLLKETSVAGYVAVTDLTKGGDIIRGRTFSAFMPLIVVALIYLVMVVFFTWLVGKLERRLRSSDH